MNRLLALLVLFWICSEAPAQSPDTVNSTQARLEADVRMLASDIGERNPIHYNELQRARTWLGQRLTSLLGAIREQTYTIDGCEVANIIAVKPGTDSSLPPIVIGAHYDSCVGTPGADDNASAVAVMLELTRRFSKEPTRHAIEFVAFTLEEPPYFRSNNMGSMRLAKEWRESNKKIELMICLEMLGYFTDEKIQEFPLPGMGFLYPESGNFIAAIGHTRPPKSVVRFTELLKKNSVFPAVSFSGPKMLTGIDFSDHQSFWNYDYPAVMVTDTGFFRNRNYHQSSDTPDTLNYPAMAKVVDSLVETIKAFDGAK